MSVVWDELLLLLLLVPVQLLLLIHLLQWSRLRLLTASCSTRLTL
jgi:hypothetical protein